MEDKRNGLVCRIWGGLMAGPELIGSLENTLAGLWEEALGGVDGGTGILGIW
jgi:hypothetical protein